MFCVSGTLSSLNRENQTWKCSSQGVCVCWRELTLERFAGLSMWGRQGARMGSSSRETAAGAGPGAPGGSGLCAPLLPGHHRMAQDTNVLPGDEWNWERLSCYQLHKWVTKREKRTLIKPGTSYTINLSQVWDLSKCFQHLEMISLECTRFHPDDV